MKLERAMKKQTVKDKPFPSTLHTRVTGQDKSVKSTYFFCEAGRTGLREALTFDIDLRVRKCVQ